MQRYLADDVELEVVYADETRFGGLLSGRLQNSVRERCASIFQHWKEHGGSATIAKSDVLMSEVLEGPLGELYSKPNELRPEVLHPPAHAIRPAFIVLSRDRRELVRVALTPTMTRDLARWLGDWSSDATPPANPGEARSLFDRFDSVGAFTSLVANDPLPACDGHFVGHATVAFGDGTRGRVLVDPYLLPRSPRFPVDYQPIVARQLDPLVAVCVTHSHPDHFSLGSLLKLKASTRIIVPRVDRESALSVGMAARLTELGFEHVEELGWHEERAVAGGRIVALPFFGEQPTTGVRLHADVRNHGNTYLVDLNGKKCLVVADSGSDSAGDARNLAEALRGGIGPLDVLFGGYRAFPQYPIEYLGSSVPEYLLFVPREAWRQRQKIMFDPDELVDLAEHWRARHVVPYACGGAPWYWLRGLGPVLDSASEQPLSRADPTPDEALRASRWRTGTEAEPLASPVEVAILRPGDGFRLASSEHDLVVVRALPHAWPFAARVPEAAPTHHVDVEVDADSRWLQFNVVLSSDTDEARRENAWRFFRRVVPVVSDLKTTARARTFFFQWKPPGLRVRVELSEASTREGASMELRHELDRARRIGAIDSYVSVVYEPEWRVFGGLDAMSAVHRCFDVDTSLYIDRLALTRSTTPEPVCDAVLWLAFVIDDLTVQSTADVGECWDVYMSLLERHAIDRDPSVAPLPDGGLVVSRGERDLLARYREEHRRFAEAITLLVNSGKLRVGVRSLLANMIQFQLNRHQLTPADQHAVVRTLVNTRDPVRVA